MSMTGSRDVSVTVMSSRNYVLMLFAISISMGQAAINDTLNPGLTNLTETSDFTCVDRALGSYYPDYDSKCQKFHLCATGEDGEVLNLSFLCPEGAAFDVRAADCLPGAIVNCERNPLNASSSSPRSVRKALKQDLRDDGANYNTSFRCGGKKLGRYYADPETGCRLFHLCAPGSSVKAELFDFQFLCLAGTLFDDALQRCLEDGKVTTATCNGLTDVTRTKRDSDDPLKVERLWKVKASKPVNVTKKTSPSKKHIERRLRAVGDPPSYDMDNLPETSFSCINRVQGGYYADVEAGCQMYHVCSVGPDNQVRNFKFLCSNGTVFSQQTRTCQTWYTVDCDSTAQFFALNDELPKLAKEETVVSPADAAAAGEPNPDIVAPRDNRDFLPSHRSASRQQEVQRMTEEDVFIPSPQPTPITRPPTRPPIPRPIQQTTVRPPQFHAVFQDVQQQQSLTQGSDASGRHRESRKRVRGRRKRVRTNNNNRLQQNVVEQQLPQQQEQEEQRLRRQQQELQQRQQEHRQQRQQEQEQLRQQQEQEEKQHVYQRVYPTTSVPEVTTPTVLVVDQGSVGFRSRIPELLDELNVRGRLTADDEQPRVSPASQRHQETPPARNNHQSAQNEHQQQTTTPTPSSFGFDEYIESALLEEARQREEFMNSQIEQQRLRPSQGTTTTTTARKRPSNRRRRPSTSTPSSEAFQRNNHVFVLTTRPPPPPPHRNNFQTTSVVTSTTSSDGILPELHEIPLFEVAVNPTTSSRLNTQSTRNNVDDSNRSWPELRPIPISQPNTNVDAILVEQFSRTSTHNGQPDGSVWNSLIDLNSRTPSDVHRVNQQAGEGGLILSAIQQPITMSDVFLLVPSAPSDRHLTPASTRHLDFSRRRQRSVVAERTPTSQFLEYDSALLTAGGPSFIPPTSFTCNGKVMGGYYADLPTDCKMFHICSSGWQRSVIYDYRFLCGNGTGFDQRSLTCTSIENLACSSSESHYPKHPLAEEINADTGPELLRRRPAVRVKRAVIENVRPVTPAELPPTDFNCAGRENGRYYADAETNCELFHLCAEISGGFMQKHSFLCPNNTVFDQRSQACDDQTDLLNCADDPPHYGIDEIFSRI